MRVNDFETHMHTAISEAKKALSHSDVPIGAIITDERSKLVSVGHNLKKAKNNSLCHAEIMALSAACKQLNSCYLIGCSIFVTLEPCAMCAGAIVNSRISNLIFGAFDLKAGACGSLMNITDDPRLNHQIKVTRGVLESECASLLTDFFSEKRH
jgi:tRNA(adenine34) deaminase